MNEKTLIKTVPLPDGQEWAWYADANIVGLAPHLDAEGRERALNEVQDHWRRSCLRVVGADDATVHAMPPQLRSPARSGATIRDVVEAL